MHLKHWFWKSQDAFSNKPNVVPSGFVCKVEDYHMSYRTNGAVVLRLFLHRGNDPLILSL